MAGRWLNALSVPWAGTVGQTAGGVLIWGMMLSPCGRSVRAFPSGYIPVIDPSLELAPGGVRNIVLACPGTCLSWDSSPAWALESASYLLTNQRRKSTVREDFLEEMLDSVEVMVEVREG